MIILVNIVLFYVVYLPENTEMTKLRLGTLGSMLSISMYASPALNVIKVINTKDPSYISFPFSVLASTSTYLWYTFGKIIDDISVIGPNFIGLGLSLITIIVWFFYAYVYIFISTRLQGYRRMKISKDYDQDGEDNGAP